MGKLNVVSADNFDKISYHLEEVYGAAFWALEAGARKGDLIAEIDEAFECFQEMKEEGLRGDK